MGEKPFRARQLLQVDLPSRRRRFRRDDRPRQGLSPAPRRRSRTIRVPEVIGGAGLGRRHPQVAAAARERPGDRDGVHSGTGSRHALHLEPGRLRDGLQRSARPRSRASTATSTPPRSSGQVWLANRELGYAPDGDRVITNVVFMGMGEPLANYRNVVPAAEIDDGRPGSRPVAPARHGQHLRPGAADAAHRRGDQRRARGLAARAERRVAQRARADQPQAPDRRAAGRVLALRREAERPQRHVRIRDARRRQRPARSTRDSSRAAARPPGQGQPDSIQPVSGHALPPFERCGDRALPRPPAARRRDRHHPAHARRRHRRGLRPARRPRERPRRRARLGTESLPRSPWCQA